MRLSSLASGIAAALLSANALAQDYYQQPAPQPAPGYYAPAPTQPAPQPGYYAPRQIQPGYYAPQQAAPQGRYNPSSEYIDSVGSGAIPALPLSAQSNNGINYITGGIGDEELAQLRSVQDQYNARFLLTATNGEFISSITMRILNAEGQVMFTASDVGPHVYASLPPGTYVFEFDPQQANVIKRIKANVPSKGALVEQVRFAVSG